jgi:S1-C subfamily serine protease
VTLNAGYRKVMQKATAILVVISVVLSSIIAIQSYYYGLAGVPLFAAKEPANALQGQMQASGQFLQNNAETVKQSNYTMSTALDSESAALNKVFEETNGSVVQITNTVKTVLPNIIINGNPYESQSTRLGSGFVYDSEGRIITNNHVVDGAKTVDVTFVDGNIYSAKVVGTDAFSDLALLQITDNLESEHLSPLVLGNSSQLQVGQQVIAIGNPFGLSDTMTTGIVSQVGRLLPNPGMGFSIPSVIQTDAAINPGNSGGPLLDLQGNVIGVNTAIKSNTGEFSGIGFAIPSNTVARIAPGLMKDGKYDHPWLGISGTSLTPELADQLGLPHDFKGVVISSVTPGGPADIAGIHGSTKNNAPSGDVATAIDGHAVKRIDDIIFYIEEQTSVGDTVVITIQRDGQSHDINVTLQSRPLPEMQTG